MWLLRTLLGGDPRSTCAIMTILVDELERLLQTEKRAKEMISAYLNTVLGDLFIQSQCSNQLELYQQWARTWSSETFKRGDKFKDEFSQRNIAWEKKFIGLHEASIAARAAKLGEPSGRTFTYSHS